jgi:hypothetical protein
MLVCFPDILKYMVIVCYKIALTLSHSWKFNALDNQEEYMKVLVKKKKKIVKCYVWDEDEGKTLVWTHNAIKFALADFSTIHIYHRSHWLFQLCQHRMNLTTIILF